MKTALLFIAAILCSLGTFAQNATYKYHFNSNLNELNAVGPALTAQCTGTYVSESLPIGVTRKTYRFNTGCGLVYNDATKNFIASGTYTIELYFRLDTISGYKKLVDFDSLKVDAGLYNQGGKIALYPSFTSTDSFVGAGIYQYVAITRDGTTKKMYINANGKTKGTYTDATNLYKLGVDKMLTFFRDDKGTGGEQSKGAIALIQISNYAMDSNTIKSNYTGLGAMLDVPGTAANSKEVIIFPNPATGNIQVTTVADCIYTICDITGKSIRTGVLRQGDNKIALDYLSNGLYLLKTESNDQMGYRVYKFIKQ